MRLGDAVLVAHLTPGHTKGCTTWTIKVQEGGRSYNAVIIGSAQVNDGYQLLNNAKYPGIAADLRTDVQSLEITAGGYLPGLTWLLFRARDQWYAACSKALDQRLSIRRVIRYYVADREQAFKAALAKEKPREVSVN